MFRDQKLEMKVGLFIGIGIFLMFFIVFSISDLTVFEKGYNIEVIFDYENGLTEDAPVRLAGVHIGEVKKMGIFYDQDASKTRVKLDIWVKGSIRIEEDAVARINTLGLLGEQYLELSPGQSSRFLKSGDVIIGKNPVNVGQQMDKMSELIGSVSTIFKKAEAGEGTLGKLLVEDTLYNDLTTITGRLSKGEGTIGKFLVDDAVYNNIEEFTADIKAHPWKLLQKPRRTKTKKTTEGKGSQL